MSKRKRDWNFTKDREIHGESNVWSAFPRKISKDLMLMLGLNETIDQLAMAVGVAMVMCCGGRMAMS